MAVNVPGKLQAILIFFPTQVQLLEGKLDVRQHVKTVPAFRSAQIPIVTVEGQESGDLPSPSRSLLVGRRIFTPSPTLPPSGGYSPGKERGLSPRLGFKHPITSTPNSASRY